jgi:hypothetical protein
MNRGRVSPQSPAVSHVVKFKRRAHERSRSCLEVALLNGTRVHWKRGAEACRRSMARKLDSRTFDVN